MAQEKRDRAVNFFIDAHKKLNDKSGRYRQKKARKKTSPLLPERNIVFDIFSLMISRCYIIHLFHGPTLSKNDRAEK